MASDPFSGQPAPVYDADGNLVSDSRLAYTWDAENRLTEVTNFHGTPDDHWLGDARVTFKYDYMGRRIEKQNWLNSGAGWDLFSTERFVYDGWNVVMVLDDSGNTVRKYTWGLDLSGQRGNPTVAGLHGAGGIGGLLAVEETAAASTPKYYFFYDANGNVQQVLQNTANYPLAAKYGYDPYGNEIEAETSGDYADTNPYRFSTKWLDREIHDGEGGYWDAPIFYYYGYRYYKPEWGRWLSRDPIEELGGSNLYLFVTNEPSSTADPLGQYVLTGCRSTALSVGVDSSAWPSYIQWFAGFAGMERFKIWASGEYKRCRTCCPETTSHRGSWQPVKTLEGKVGLDFRFAPTYKGVGWGPFRLEGAYGATWSVNQTFSAFVQYDGCTESYKGGGCLVDFKGCGGVMGGAKIKAWGAEGKAEIIGQICVGVKVCFVGSTEDFGKYPEKLRWQVCVSGDVTARGTIKVPVIGESRLTETFSANGCTDWHDLAGL